MDRPQVDLEEALLLAAALENEEIGRKLALRKRQPGLRWKNRLREARG